MEERKKPHQHEIIIFGDIHTDPACYQTITKLLPELKEKGYKTIYIETSPCPLKDIIEEIENTIEHIMVFPNYNVPEKKKRTKEQEEFLNKTYLCYRNGNGQKRAIEWANETLKFHEGRLEWCVARKKFLEKAIELELNIICIDVEDTSKYSHAGGMGERTRYMMGKITENLITKQSSKSIIITGLGHVVDTSESDKNGWQYNYGFLREIAKIETMKISECFFIFSKHEGLKNKALKDISSCADNIVKQIKIVDLSNKQIEINLSSLIDKGVTLSFISEDIKVSEVKNKYTTLIFHSIQNKESYSAYIKSYISDLGGVNIEIKNNENGNTSIEFEINSMVLNSPGRRNILSLDRCHVPRLELAKAEFLKIPFLVIEDCFDKNGLPAYLLTFTDTRDGRVKNQIQRIGNNALSSVYNQNSMLASSIQPEDKEENKFTEREQKQGKNTLEESFMTESSYDPGFFSSTTTTSSLLENPTEGSSSEKTSSLITEPVFDYKPEQKEEKTTISPSHSKKG